MWIEDAFAETKVTQPLTQPQADHSQDQRDRFRPERNPRPSKRSKYSKTPSKPTRRTRANAYEEPMDMAETTQSDQLSGEEDFEGARPVSTSEELSPASKEGVQPLTEQAKPARPEASEAMSEPTTTEFQVASEEVAENTTCELGENQREECRWPLSSSARESNSGDIGQWGTWDFQGGEMGNFSDELDIVNWSSLGPLNGVPGMNEVTSTHSVAIRGWERTVYQNSSNTSAEAGIASARTGKTVWMIVAEESLRALKSILSADSSRPGANPR